MLILQGILYMRRLVIYHDLDMLAVAEKDKLLDSLANMILGRGLVASMR